MRRRLRSSRRASSYVGHLPISCQLAEAGRGWPGLAGSGRAPHSCSGLASSGGHLSCYVGHKAHQEFGQSGAEQPCLTSPRGCPGRHLGPASLGQPASRAALLLAGHSRLAFHIGEQLRSVEAQLGRRAAAPGAPPPARSPYMRQARQAGPSAARLAERQHRAHLCGRQRRRGSGQFPLQRQVNQAQGGV